MRLDSIITTDLVEAIAERLVLAGFAVGDPVSVFPKAKPISVVWWVELPFDDQITTPGEFAQVHLVGGSVLDGVDSLRRVSDVEWKSGEASIRLSVSGSRNQDSCLVISEQNLV